MTALAMVDEAGVKEGRPPAELLEDLKQRDVSPETVAALEASIHLVPLTEGIEKRFAPLANEQHATQRQQRPAAQDRSQHQHDAPDVLGPTMPMDPSEVPLPPTVVMPHEPVASPSPGDLALGLTPVGTDGLPIRPGTGHPLTGWHLTWYDACVWLLRPRNLPAAVLGAVLAGVFLGLVLSTVG